MKVKFAVVTKVPPDNDPGNLAFDPKMFIDEPGKPICHIGEKFRSAMIVFRTTVFTLGEIMVLDVNDREISGRSRKPSKWCIEFKSFDTIEEAILCAEEVNASSGFANLLTASKDDERYF